MSDFILARNLFSVQSVTSPFPVFSFLLPTSNRRITCSKVSLVLSKYTRLKCTTQLLTVKSEKPEKPEVKTEHHKSHMHL
jgi:hypothetical protein